MSRSTALLDDDLALLVFKLSHDEAQHHSQRAPVPGDDTALVIVPQEMRTTTPIGQSVVQAPALDELLVCALESP